MTKNYSRLTKRQKLWILFTSTFLISAVTFGGGYVIVPLLQKKYTQELGWIDENEMLDLLAITQLSPGAVAINAAIVIGYKISGGLGAVVSTTAATLPPMIILTLFYHLYDWLKDNPLILVFFEGLQIGVCVLMLDVSLKLLSQLWCQKNWVSWFLFSVAMGLNFIFHLNLFVILVSVSLIGIFLSQNWGNRHVD